MANTFYRMEILNRAKPIIFGAFSAFEAPKEGQILIFDKCVFYKFNQYQKSFHLRHCTSIVYNFIVRNFAIMFDIEVVPSVSRTFKTLVSIFCTNLF